MGGHPSTRADAAPQRNPIKVSNLVNGAVAKIDKNLVGRPVNLSLQDDLPMLDGDPAILERVVINIMDNACQYAPHDQPITISAKREANYVRLTITDRGPGIPEEERERIFDMFYRVKSGATPASGAGLGLAICRGFVEAHGGRIAAQPGPDGVGTQIVVRLPIIRSLTSGQMA